MSKTHEVKLKETLGKISIKYYGLFSKWTSIRNANPQLVGRNKAIDGSPLIYPGDILIIPDEQPVNKIALKIPALNTDELAIIVDGNRFNYFTEYSLIQEMDAFDSFSFSAPFDDTNETFINSFKPFSYKQCQVYYGGDLFFNGILLAPQTEANSTSKILTLTGYPKCGVLNDCPLPISMFPCEFNNQDLKQIASKMIQPFNIDIDFSESPGNKFEKVTPKMEEKILSFLINLAEQRDLIISNNIEGNLLFWKTKTGSTIAEIKQDETPFLSCKPTFNPQDFYSHITGVNATSEKKLSQKYTYENTYLTKLGVFRPYIFLVQDAKEMDIKKATITKAGKMFGSSCGYQLTLAGHRDKNKNFWRKNTLIMLESPGAMIYKNTKFMIKKVTTSRTSEGGDTTILDLVLPESYSGVIPNNFPWEK